MKSSRKNLRCLARREYFNNGMLLVRKQSHPYKHVSAQLMIMHKNRCRRPQRIKVNIIKRNNTELTATMSKRMRDKRGRKCTRVMNSLAKRGSRNA